MDSKLKVAAGIVALLIVGSVLSATVIAEPGTVTADGPNTAEPGDQVTVDFTITNTGNNDSAYALDHTIPSDWTVVSTSDAGGTYSDGKSEWVFQTIQPGDSKEPSVTFQIPNDAQTGDYTVEGVGKDQNGPVDSDSTTITVESPTPTPTPEPPTPTPTPGPDTPTPTFVDDDDDDEPDTPTPTDQPGTATPTDEPETATPTDEVEPGTATPTDDDEPETATPTDEPDTPTDTPDDDDGVSTFLILLVVLILIAVVAGVAYYALNQQE
ncbi:NEW3 domain-containing protein [Natronomonas marina]|jgi:hypothetical protein|uniref:NEW3 domain-containing protein n=1 Tax=Natronomonas marina TaxID=2961939 RepID=UPI0020C990EB|nr:NEW3 domain-containing protein [Natronomonas marina]